jgi:D-alanyl-D-alanine carboxypeptidase
MFQRKKVLYSFLILISCSSLLCGCNSNSQNANLTEASSSIETNSSTQIVSSSNANASTTQSNIDVTKLPEVLDTIAVDPENKLMLINKLHAVSKDYYPTDMVVIDNSLSTYSNLYLKREAYEAYLKMLEDANAQDINFLICSAYRSYELQESLYNNSLAANGEEYTYTYSAYPGRSEHQTGWAIDLTSESIGYTLSQNFGNLPEGKWIEENCSNYGFIIRYLDGKTDITGYSYEPWHLRYVGVEVAKEITSKGITLEEYLGEA